MAAQLNRTKPYGTVCGGLVKHCYEQNNKLFNHEGEEVNENGVLMTTIEAKAKADAENAPKPGGEPAAKSNQPAKDGGKPETTKKEK